MHENNPGSANQDQVEDVIASDLLGGDILHTAVGELQREEVNITEGGITDVTGTVPLGGSSDVVGTGDAAASADTGATTGAGALGSASAEE